MGETTEGLLDQKVMGIKRAKRDVLQSQVLGGAGVAVGLEVTVPAPCPGTLRAGHDARQTPEVFPVMLLVSLVGGGCCTCRRHCHLPAVSGVPGYSWSNTFCRSL